MRPFVSPKLGCSLCPPNSAQRSLGAKVQCQVAKCTVAFHPTCAIEAGYRTKRPGEMNSEDRYTVMCAKHSRQERDGAARPAQRTGRAKKRRRVAAT